MALQFPTVASVLNAIVRNTTPTAPLRTETHAANVLAGTTSLTLAGALNALAGTADLSEAGAANSLAGTTGETLVTALNIYYDSLP